MNEKNKEEFFKNFLNDNIVIKKENSDIHPKINKEKKKVLINFNLELKKEKIK